MAPPVSVIQYSPSTGCPLGALVPVLGRRAGGPAGVDRLRLRLIVAAEVRRETVEEGLAAGMRCGSHRASDCVDACHRGFDHGYGRRCQLQASRAQGVLVTNDVALGRRAANLGIQYPTRVRRCARCRRPDGTWGSFRKMTQGAVVAAARAARVGL